MSLVDSLRPVQRGSGDSSPQPVASGTRRRKRGVIVWVATAWLTILALAAVFADVLPIPDYETPTPEPGLAPGWRFPDFLGTDPVGRSILSRAIYGARISLVVGLAGTLVGLLVGGLIGLLAAYFRGWLESVVDTVSATILSFPPLVLVMALVAVLNPGLWTVTLCLGLLAIPAFARLAKANALAQVGREYVVVARAMGASSGRLLFREILPNTLVPAFSLAAVSIAILIAVEGSLSFLGLSIPPPQPSWGGMISEGKDSLRTDPHLVLIPCFVMFMTIYSFNTLGDYLRSRFDVRDSKL
ncbi:MAG: ABC transporter permease subunit [Pseudonocardiaceae bacterium]|nr:ABC transporter permease subunit [Pseudonocardiaceae bacterium]